MLALKPAHAEPISFWKWQAHLHDEVGPFIARRADDNRLIVGSRTGEIAEIDRLEADGKSGRRWWRRGLLNRTAAQQTNENPGYANGCKT